MNWNANKAFLKRTEQWFSALHITCVQSKNTNALYGDFCNCCFKIIIDCCLSGEISEIQNLMEIYEPRSEKTGFLHMRKQRRRSASR